MTGKIIKIPPREFPKFDRDDDGMTAAEREEGQNALKRIGMGALWGLASAAATGSFGGAFAGAGLYGVWRGMVNLWKSSENSPLAFGALMIGGMVLALEYGGYHHVYQRVTAPREYTQERLLLQAAREMMKGDNGPINKCEGVYEFAPFGKRGKKIGDECLTLTLEKRDGMSFMARSKFQSDKTDELQGFRPESWALWPVLPTSGGPGYENARMIFQAPEP